MPQLIELMDGIPAASDQGHLAFCSVTMIEGEDRDGELKRILVDAAHVGRRPLLVDSLARLGLTTLDIDYVVITHAHWDHLQNSDLFTAATTLIHPDERKYAHSPAIDDWATPSWTGYLLEQLQLEEVDDGFEIIPGVEIVDMRGHTVGTIGVSVETDLGISMLTSDAIHIGSVATSGVNPLVFWDEDHASDTIQRIIDKSDVIYPGHDMPFRMLSDGTLEYLRAPSLAIAGITPGVVDGPVLPVTWMPGRHDPGLLASWRDASDEGRRAVRSHAYPPGAAPVPSSEWDGMS